MVNKKFLNKVVEWLIEDTPIDKEIEMSFMCKGIYGGTVLIKFPFVNCNLRLLLKEVKLTLPHATEETIINHLFDGYCYERYGVIREELPYVWENYYSALQDKIQMDIITYGRQVVNWDIIHSADRVPD